MNACREWKDSLLDFVLGALTGAEARAVEQHLTDCPRCAAALKGLRARAEALDAAVHQLVREASPSPSLEARLQERVVADAGRVTWSRTWLRPLVTAGALMLAGVLFRAPQTRAPETTFPAGQPGTTLSGWRSPTENLLRAPGGELLESTPRLGEFYFPLKLAPKDTKQSKGGSKNEA